VSVEHHCTASIGVVIFIDHEGSQDDILKWADAAMYQAKEAGGNRIRDYASGA
jgi:diguanylate cyclase (GGDEF)-like protein